MFWSSFFGALAGVLITLGVVIAAAVIWDHFDRRARRRARQNSDDFPHAILESRLEQYMVTHFDELFPGWTIFDDSPAASDASEQPRKPSGIQYKTRAGRIDMLCIDRKGHFVVVELKRHRAPDSVVAQVDRYISWVKKRLAAPKQRVKGIVIAESYDPRLFHTISQRRGISAWTYAWRMKLNKRPGPEA